VDLPGTYSLISRSADERIARDVMLGLIDGVEPIDVVLVVIDAGNLQRNLYLATQIIDLGFPVVLCCNMIDAAEATGQSIDLAGLSRRLGVPVVGTIANRGSGIADLKHAVTELTLANGRSCDLSLPQTLTHEIDRLAERIGEIGIGRSGSEGGLATLLLASNGMTREQVEGEVIPAQLVTDVDQALARLADSGPSDPAAAIAQARFKSIRTLLTDVVSTHEQADHNWTDRIDRIVTHPLLGLLVFAAVMFVMFLSIFSWAAPVMTGVESLFGAAGDYVSTHLAEGMLRSLLVHGVINGVGAVVVFLPQICILFFFICLMEDTGYMARAAMVMNRWMAKVGLPGKSFIPLMSSFACAIPGIMAARTIENRRDRFVTILIAPFMSCSARLPIYIIMIGALFGGSVWLQAGIMLTLYLLGIVTALAVAMVLKRTVLRGPQSGFLIELPPYRRPHVPVVLRAMWERSVLFLKDAGTIIFAVSVVLWVLAYFPRADAAAAAEDSGLQLRQSCMGRVGRLIEPVIEPLGFDWRIGIGLIGSFAAREVFISTMGIVYGVGGDVDEASEPLREKIATATWPDGRRVYTPLVGISLMVFYALACQCVSTLGVVRRETNSWRWPTLMFCYMTVLAYCGSLLVYQVGSAMEWGV
ncbi:MAG: ferrous iron transport protein B, partial [Planctomycetes bacterium]|nr:ferrous iron transport protein B [Planctomycetota bacterium]